MEMICGCIINTQGEAPDTTKCKGGVVGGRQWKHSDTATHQCCKTHCEQYKPNRMPVRNTDWPKCVCGEFAQEHS